MAKKDNLQNQIIIYESESSHSHIKVQIDGETVWLSQAQLVDLFQSSKANISEHIKNIFNEKELERDSVVRKFRTTASDGKNPLAGSKFHFEPFFSQNTLNLTVGSNLL